MTDPTPREKILTLTWNEGELPSDAMIRVLNRAGFGGGDGPTIRGIARGIIEAMEDTPINHDAAAIRALQRQLADTQIERDAALARITAALALHVPVESESFTSGYGVTVETRCDQCVETAWPCTTARALSDPNPED